MTWHTAPAGLYHLRNGAAIPVVLVNENGEGLLPDGTTTRNYYAHLHGWTPTGSDETTINRGDYMRLVREAEQQGIPPCPHGEPRGNRFCALCRRGVAPVA